MQRRAFLIRYALEINDPSLAELLRRADAGEAIDNPDVPLASVQKIEALAEIICRAGNESTAALLVLMATLEDAPEPEALAHAAKHFAFTRCGELNLYGMVEAQTALVESELFTANSFAV
jgi:hypothetical protein